MYRVFFSEHFCSILHNTHVKKLSVYNHYLMICVFVSYILSCVTLLKHLVEIKLWVEKMYLSAFIRTLETKTHTR
jgi:hypothetical protein